MKSEINRLERIERGINSEFGKTILEIINEYEKKAISDFIGKDVSGFNEGQIVAFAYSLRGKLQVLKDIQRLLGKATEDKKILQEELLQFKEIES